MKYLIGAMLVLGGLLLIPSVQKTMLPIFEMTIVRLINLVFKNFKLRRLHLSLWGSASFTALVFAIVPVWHWAIGVICIIIAAIMLWAAPRWSWVRRWMQEIFFGDLDIFNEESPYAPILIIFKWPLFALGAWIIVPWGAVLVDVLGIILLVLEILKRLGVAEGLAAKMNMAAGDDVDAAKSENEEKDDLGAESVVGETPTA